jgi:DNA-binding CsgD family transcriptional regulator
MVSLDEYSELVSAIYDAAVDFDRWPVALERLCDALGGSMAVLLGGNLGRDQGTWLSVRVDPVFDQLYLDYFREHNELWQRAGTMPVKTCVIDREVMPKEELLRTEFYNDFLLRQDVHTALRVNVLAEPDCTAVISVGRSPRQGEWEREQVDLARRLAPHLHRAAQINLRLGEARLREASWAEAVETLPHGVMIVSGEGKVLLRNGSARAILADGDGIGIDGTVLRAADRQDNTALRGLIAAAATAATESAATGGMLALQRPSGRRPLAVLVVPLHVGPGWPVNRQPAAIVFVADPERTPVVPERYLQHLYNLTPAEAAVAARILRGEGLQAVADDLRVSLETVRTHRQRVFEKTQTRRQAELVRLILGAHPGIDLPFFRERVADEPEGPVVVDLHHSSRQSLTAAGNIRRAEITSAKTAPTHPFG